MNNETMINKDDVFTVSAKLENCIQLLNLTLGQAQELETASPENKKLVAAMTGVKDYLSSIDSDLERLVS
ncbi:hypothetical protein ACOI22_03830 [Glaciecola sp. 2405UD65-10]|uniref:hypothetical protein n=1 Tax=Glaciecola sp. 2405UD65-10 TaxID=3397244 RepID=UPI003B594D60